MQLPSCIVRFFHMWSLLFPGEERRYILFGQREACCLYLVGPLAQFLSLSFDEETPREKIEPTLVMADADALDPCH